jgi:hypothetical protein
MRIYVQWMFNEFGVFAAVCDFSYTQPLYFALLICLAGGTNIFVVTMKFMYFLFTCVFSCNI